MNKLFSMLGTVALVACSASAGNESATEKASKEAQVTANAPAPAPQLTNAVLAEPKGQIDPKSAEAAGQVVQQYGALIEQKRFAEAEKLWTNAESAAQFTRQLKQYAEAHLEIGNPGDLGGAAGSIYVTVPAIFYGDDANGGEFRRSADVILRRVNDVPGSTEEQRRWHIDRIEWQDAA
ncbi:MAG TPA: hypothetical protein VF757_01085 [Sphingomicrobium sp.]